MKTAKIYVLVTQLLVQMFVVIVGVYYLVDYLTDHHKYWPGILSVIAALLNLWYFIIVIIKNGEKYGK